jgi:acyl carrier protein
LASGGCKAHSVSLYENNPVVQLDSVDALEIVMALQRTYNVHIDDHNR